MEFGAHLPLIDFGTGLPTVDVDSTIHNLIGWEALLTFLGVAAAGVVGAIVVRRQLRPLREVAGTAHAVAALPLASGELLLIAIGQTQVTHVSKPINGLLSSLAMFMVCVWQTYLNELGGQFLEHACHRNFEGGG